MTRFFKKKPPTALVEPAFARTVQANTKPKQYNGMNLILAIQENGPEQLAELDNQIASLVDRLAQLNRERNVILELIRVGDDAKSHHPKS
jgi:hypothetical protein